jgi:CheY-like chemotaxis protein
MSLVGNLEDLSLPDILQIVSLSKKSGILMLEREGMQGKIIIRQGKVIQTVAPRSGKTLGEILTARGMLRPEELKNALELQHAGGTRELLGTILIRQGRIDAPTLEKVVQEQIEDAIVFFLTWKEGTFSFELADVQGRGEFSVDPQAFILERGIDTQWLVLEGTRVIDERARAGQLHEAGPEVEGCAETSFASVEEGSGGALVVVDDDPAFRELAAERGGRLGFRVIGCEGVAQGLRTIAEEARRPGPPPAVVADVVMPTTDNQGFLGGLELLEKLSAAHPGVPVAIVTAYPDENVKARVLELGGHFFLKPAGPGSGESVGAFFAQVTGSLGAHPGAPAAPAAPAVAAAPAAPVAEAPVAAPPASRAAPPAPPAPPAPAGPARSEREVILDALNETRAAIARQEKAAAAAIPGLEEGALLHDMLEELQSPRATSEIGLLVLRFAAELLNRAVLFVVKGGKAVGLGGFGVEIPAGAGGRGVRAIAIPLDEPSILGDVVRTRAAVRGPVAEVPWNRTLLEQLGGRTPGEAVALPLLSGGRVRVILYGDNLPEARPLAGTKGLELFLAQAGLTLQRVLLEKKLQEVPEPGAAAGQRHQQQVGGGVR